MGEPMPVAAVILAAGASTRFGSQKQRARIGDRTMLEAVIAVARDAGLSPILVVVPPGLAVPADVVPVINGQPGRGISRSLQLGIHALPPEVQAALILLGDQPTVDVGTLRAMLDLARTDPRPVVAIRADDRFGPPVLLTFPAFDLVDAAAGDSGLGRVLASRPDLVASVERQRHAPDIDSPEDLRRLL